MRKITQKNNAIIESFSSLVSNSPVIINCRMAEEIFNRLPVKRQKMLKEHGLYPGTGVTGVSDTTVASTEAWICQLVNRIAMDIETIMEMYKPGFLASVEAELEDLYTKLELMPKIVDKNAELQLHVAKLKAEVTQLKEANQKLYKLGQSQITRIADLNTTIADIKQQWSAHNEQHKKDWDDLVTRAKKQTADFNKHNDLLKTTMEKNSEFIEKLSKTEDTNNKLKKEITALQAKASSLQVKVSSLEVKVSSLEVKVSSLQKRSDDSQAAMADSQAAMADSQAAITALQAQLATTTFPDFRQTLSTLTLDPVTAFVQNKIALGSAQRDRICEAYHYLDQSFQSEICMGGVYGLSLAITGSACTSACTSAGTVSAHSDLDVVLCSPLKLLHDPDFMAKILQWTLRLDKDHVVRYDHAGQITLIEFTTCGIEVDLSFSREGSDQSSCIGLKRTRQLNDLLGDMHDGTSVLVAPVVVVLKDILFAARLNKPFTGGVSGYVLFWLVQYCYELYPQHFHTPPNAAALLSFVLYYYSHGWKHYNKGYVQVAENLASNCMAGNCQTITVSDPLPNACPKNIVSSRTRFSLVSELFGKLYSRICTGRLQLDTV